MKIYYFIINRTLFSIFFLVVVVLLASCHVYYRGVIINNTKDTISVMTKPSLLIYERDMYYKNIVQINTENNDSIFAGSILPNDSLFFNSGPSYSTALSVIDYLKIIRGKDSLICFSRKEIRRQTKILKRNFNKVMIGISVTDSLLLLTKRI